MEIKKNLSGILIVLFAAGYSYWLLFIVNPFSLEASILLISSLILILSFTSTASYLEKYFERNNIRDRKQILYLVLFLLCYISVCYALKDTASEFFPDQDTVKVFRSSILIPVLRITFFGWKHLDHWAAKREGLIK
jgi:hypothetical protein